MDVARFSKPRQILSDDDVTAFSCGNEDVDAWLRDRAKRARAQGTAVTYVTFDEDGSIAGFYVLSAVFVARNEVVGGWLRRNVFEASRYPRPSGRVQITSRRTPRVLRRGSRVPPPGSPGRSQEVVVGHHVRARPRDGGGRVEAMLRATGAWRQDGRQGHPGHRRPPRPFREGPGPFPGAAYAKRKPRLVRTANGSGAQVR